LKSKFLGVWKSILLEWKLHKWHCWEVIKRTWTF